MQPDTDDRTFRGSIVIEDLERGVNGTDTGWSWTHLVWSDTGVWDAQAGKAVPGYRRYRRRTNSRYEGLWTWREEGRWDQIEGTLQFALSDHRGQALHTLRYGK